MDTGEDLGKLLLRLLVGGLLILHGIHKIQAGPAAIEVLVFHHGLPPDVAYGVYLGEVLGPVLMILGLFARVRGLLALANMIIAVWLTRAGAVWALNAQGGWVIELEAFYGLGGLAVALLGAGRYALGRPHTWLN